MATVSMKCPNCGGELIFDPKSQKYKCEYCGSDFALDEISTEEAATQAVSDVVQEREDTSDNHTQQRTAGAEDAASAVYLSELWGTDRDRSDDSSNILLLLSQSGIALRTIIRSISSGSDHSI